jgi:tetratricopeptide (TPR) repeat protein
VHLSSFQLNFEKHQWEISQNRRQDFPFEKISNQLNAWYAGQLMQLACIEMSHNNFQRQEKTSKSEWTQALVQYLPEKPHENTPAVALYFKSYQMLYQLQSDVFLQEFKAVLAQYSTEMTLAEARGLLMLAINHGIRRINEGDKKAIQDTLDFYLLGLEKKLLQDDRGVLSKHTYNNVLMTWESALVFLEKYREQLSTSERDNIYQYNLSVYHYRRGDFDAALDLLRNVTFPDPNYNLESRKMLLKIYFEQESHDALESLIDNLLTWLRRHGELGYHREMFRNLATFTRKLLRLLPNDRKGRLALEQRILDTPLVAERGWLLEKVRD